MAVVIRMKRTGRRNRPCYRISVADKAAPRNGRTLETLGVYDPISPVPELRLKLDVERARHWLSRGAVPSFTVGSILRREGVIEERPQKVRKRKGRNAKTASRAHRAERKEKLVELKTARRSGRVAARRAAKAEAAAAAAAEEGS